MLSALSGAATGHVGLCCFPQVDALLVDAARTLRAVQGSVCENGESKAVKDRIHVVSVCFVKTVSCRLTSRHTVEADSDKGGLDREAAGQATQHRLNRVAFGFLAMNVYLFLQLHRFKLHTALCERKVLVIIPCSTGLLSPNCFGKEERRRGIYLKIGVAVNEPLCLTSGVPTALGGQDPGMSITDCALGHTSVGCAVLLSDFPISLSTESTGLSLHPVHHFYLHMKIEPKVSSKCSSS